MAAELSFELIAKMMDDISAPARAINASLEGINKTVKRSQSTFESYSRTATKNFNDMKKSVVEVGVAIGAFALGVSAVVKPAMEFASSLKTIQIESGRTEAQSKALGNVIFDISKKLNIGSQALANSLKDLPASVRNSTEELRKVMTVAGQYARMFDIDIGEAVKAVTPIMKNFNLTSKELPKAFDEMAKAATMAKIPIGVLQEALPKLTTEWKALGLTGTAGFAKGLAVTERTGDAEAATTAYIKVAEKMNSPKFQIGSLSGQMLAGIAAQASAKGLDPFLAKINAIRAVVHQQAGGNLQNENILISGLFGGKGMGIAFKDFENAAGRAKIITEDLYHSTGVVAGGAEDRMKEWGESWKRFGNTIDRVKLQVGTDLGKSMSPLADTMNDITESFGTFVHNYPGIVGAAGLIGASLLTLAGTVGILGLAFTALAANPIIATLMAAAAVTAGLSYEAYKLGQKVKEKGWKGGFTKEGTEGKGLFESIIGQQSGMPAAPGAAPAAEEYIAPPFAPPSQFPQYAAPQMSGLPGGAANVPGVKPLVSIDIKMSTLIDVIKRNADTSLVDKRNVGQYRWSWRRIRQRDKCIAWWRHGRWRIRLWWWRLRERRIIWRKSRPSHA